MREPLELAKLELSQEPGGTLRRGVPDIDREINFIATERGLEDQLLAKVVEMERKDLEEKLTALTTAAIDYQIQLVG